MEKLEITNCGGVLRAIGADQSVGTKQQVNGEQYAVVRFGIILTPDLSALSKTTFRFQPGKNARMRNPILYKKTDPVACVVEVSCKTGDGDTDVDDWLRLSGFYPPYEQMVLQDVRTLIDLAKQMTPPTRVTVHTDYEGEFWDYSFLPLERREQSFLNGL